MARLEASPTRWERQHQSPFDDCFTTLGESHEESAYRAIERLVEAGEQVGFSVSDLIQMLKGGMSLESLLDVIEVRMAGSYLHDESTAVTARKLSGNRAAERRECWSEA